MSHASNLTQRPIFDFPGGLHLEYHKDESTREPIRQAPIPSRLVLPLKQHIGQAAKPCVAVGDYVFKGQTIATADGYVSTPIHASSSGTVTHIGDHPIAHPSGLSDDCIVIETDGEDQPLPKPELEPIEDYSGLDPAELRNRVRAAGIVGLGGAAFPSFIKLNPGSERLVDTLILNGAECEPYIACDQALMSECPEDIIAGAQLIKHAVQARECLIGVEDNKPDAIAALQKVISSLPNDSGIEIIVVPTRYPQGGEKQLIQTLTGKEVPSDGLPIDIGIVCQNVGTAAAVWRAVTQGEPLIERVMSVTGDGVTHPCNVRARIGTPVNELVAECGGYVDDEPARLLMGGPMMGFALHADTVPVVKATNCILVMTAEQVKPEEPAMPCIRCGACADHCPASLLPQQLYWHARSKDFDEAQNYRLFDCIECGVCAQVCPSHIPLVQFYRYAKTEIWSAERERLQSDIARQRHEARKQRIEREQAEAEAKRAAKRKALDTPASEGGSSAVADAIARAKQKKESLKDSMNQPPKTAAETGTDAVAAAIAKAKAAKSGNKSDDQPAASAAGGSAAAIIAKAKAAKDAQSSAGSSAADIIARAKAAKAPSDDNTEATPTQSAAGLTGAAAIIARAKASAGISAEDHASTAPVADPKPAASTAADIIARARSKAAGEQPAQTSEQQTPTASQYTTSNAEDPVILAIAREKARRAARARGEAVPPSPYTTAGLSSPPVDTDTQGGLQPTVSASDDDPVARAIAAEKARRAARDQKTESA